MPLDSVRPLGIDHPAEGGTQTASVPTEVNTLQDALAAAGLFIDGPTVSVADKTVLLDRAASGNLRMTDQVTSRLLAELVTSVSGQVGAHDGLRDAQHFLAGEGPGPGFASGAVCTRNYSGVLLTSEVWWTSASLQTKIYSRTLSYAAGSLLPTTITHVMYSSTGAALRTVTDSLTYTGVLLTTISRVWS